MDDSRFGKASEQTFLGFKARRWLVTGLHYGSEAGRGWVLSRHCGLVLSTFA